MTSLDDPSHLWRCRPSMTISCIMSLTISCCLNFMCVHLVMSRAALETHHIKKINHHRTRSRVIYLPSCLKDKFTDFTRIHMDTLSTLNHATDPHRSLLAYSGGYSLQCFLHTDWQKSSTGLPPCPAHDYPIIFIGKYWYNGEKCPYSSSSDIGAQAVWHKFFARL